MSPEDWEVMLAAHENRCAICGREFAARREAKIDHDHKTGKVRNMLCNFCNAGLGQMLDDPAIVAKALLYLERHGASRERTEIHPFFGMTSNNPPLLPR